MNPNEFSLPKNFDVEAEIKQVQQEIETAREAAWQLFMPVLIETLKLGGYVVIDSNDPYLLFLKHVWKGGYHAGGVDAYIATSNDIGMPELGDKLKLMRQQTYSDIKNN